MLLCQTSLRPLLTEAPIDRTQNPFSWKEARKSFFPCLVALHRSMSIHGEAITPLLQRTLDPLFGCVHTENAQRGVLWGTVVGTSPAQAGLRTMNWRLCFAERNEV